MAAMSDIKVSIELRPCLVTNEDTEKKALFHLWEQRTSGDVSRILGIVELEDGTVRVAAPYNIRFMDNKIQEYSFEPAGSSPVCFGKSEKFGEIDGHSIYVVRDEHGRIVVSDELFKELIERCK